LATVSRYLECIPVLSTTMPPGVRFTESYAGYDSEAGSPPRESQLFHRDLHDTRDVYMIVLLQDVTMESGPFCFLPASASERAAKALRYRARGCPYRI